MSRLRFAVVAFLAFPAASCDDDARIQPITTAPSPVSPSPASPSPASPVTTGEQIRGGIADTAFRPLGGARIEILDGPNSGTSAVTDSNGSFSLSAIVDDATRVRASKDGHVTASAVLGPVCDRCNPKRWVYFNLEMNVPPVDLTGNYAVTFIADTTCTNLPDSVRTRTYAATITRALAQAPTNSLVNVTLTGSQFVTQTAYKSFSIGVADNFLSLGLGDFHGDPGLVEDLGGNAYLAFEGSAEATTGRSRSTISTTFDGSVEYCALNGPMNDGRYQCTPSSDVTPVRCNSRNHQIIFTPR